MKQHSIRLKFFAAIAAIALSFIGILLILNIFFYESYYLFTHKKELKEAYQQLSVNYTGDVSVLLSEFDTIERRGALRLAIAYSDGTFILPYVQDSDSSSQTLPDTKIPDQYLSPFEDFIQRNPAQKQDLRGISVLSAVVREMNWDTVSHDGFQFLTVSPRDDEQYLCLAGTLDQSGTCLIAYMPYAFIEQNSMFSLIFILISGSFTLIVCLALAFLLSRQFTKPLIAMNQIANNMAELDFSQKYETASQDEIGQLGESLNRLSSHLEHSIDELKATNARLEQEILEKQRIDDMRREFIVNVSHELKTPIALIQGYAEGLQYGIAENAEDREFYCNTISEEADHMNKLVMQLLNLSKLELGAETIYNDDIDLYTLCEAAVRKTAVLCESKNLDVIYENTHEVVYTDPALLEQVLMNYLSNAIRYTKENGKIEITASSSQAFTRLSVFNEGNGLPEEELPKIWEKFYRTDNARSREDGGTGIGLSLVRAIAELLHGNCGAYNTESGIIFWIEIPKSASESA